jgi:hypothetical protein
MDARAFGLAHADFVRAPYATLDDARAQGDHNVKTGKQTPLRIVDEQGKTLHDYSAK